MEWLNYHHLLYFWLVAREGGLAPAAARLRLALPARQAQDPRRLSLRQTLLDHPLDHPHAIQLLVAHAHCLHARGGTAGRWRKRTFLLWRNRTFLSGYYMDHLTESFLSDVSM